MDYPKYKNPNPYPGLKDREARREWRVETYRLEYVVFKEDLKKEYLDVDTSDEVKQKVFDMAWGSWHSSGLREVERHYEELAELVNLQASWFAKQKGVECP